MSSLPCKFSPKYPHLSRSDIQTRPGFPTETKIISKERFRGD
jgi:hypothetical protein